LASALDLEAGETVTWKVVDRTHLLLVRLPERKPLTGMGARISHPVHLGEIVNGGGAS
jgi:hypothetical protein